MSRERASIVQRWGDTVGGATRRLRRFWRPQPEVVLLNDLVGLPSAHQGTPFSTTLDARLYLFDYNYLDRAKGREWLSAIATLRRERGIDFGKKTLLLHARGLDPLNGALLDFAREFGEQHVFVELWNRADEIGLLRDARLENLYFLPVTSALPWLPRQPLPLQPSRRVFVSLGGDDDLDLVRETIRECRDLHFFVPDLAWEKGAVQREFPVAVSGRNVTRVPCRHRRIRSFSWSYRASYAACDTVLIATSAAKRMQMRGGIRVADALDARKHLVITSNPMCELLMAQHEKTCLVASHEAGGVAAALRRTTSGAFQPDRKLYEEIRALTRDEAKLHWMVGAAEGAGAARRSAFFRDIASLDRISGALPSSTMGGRDIDALFNLTQGDTLSAGGGAGFRVQSIRQRSETSYRVALARGDDGMLELEVSTALVERYYTRTNRGHWLWYLGESLSADEAGALRQVAERL